VRDSQRVVFRVVEGQDFMLGLLHQDVQPDGQVRTNHVHQAEAGQRAVPGNLHLLHRKNDSSVPCPSARTASLLFPFTKTNVHKRYIEMDWRGGERRNETGL